MKYRIKKTIDIGGCPQFIPQFKKFGIYWDFWEVNFPPHKISLGFKEDAERFIQRQKQKPKDEFFYL
jgi:hypothetical protein